MRSLRVGVMALGAVLAAAAIAAGSSLALSASGGGRAHAAAGGYHVTLVSAASGAWGYFGVTAKLATSQKCRVTETEHTCAQSNLKPDGSYSGVLHLVHGAGDQEYIRFRVNLGGIVWDPVTRHAVIILRAPITSSSRTSDLGEWCPDGNSIYVMAALQDTRKGLKAECRTAKGVFLHQAVMTRPAVAMTGDALSSQWTINAPWHSSQSNNYHLTWNVAQTGTAVTGTVAFAPGEAARAGLTQVGRITHGKLVGNRLDVILVFGSVKGGTLRGEYAGHVSRGAVKGQSRIGDGTAWNPDNRQGTYHWNAGGPASCWGPCR